jgi:hypothetical protein
MFLVMKLIKEMETQVNYFPHMPSTMKLQSDDGMIGVLPVFDTVEQAEAYANGARIIEITGAPERSTSSNVSPKVAGSP